jgi:hypothetical protein
MDRRTDYAVVIIMAQEIIQYIEDYRKLRLADSGDEYSAEMGSFYFKVERGLENLYARIVGEAEGNKMIDRVYNVVCTSQPEGGNT